MDKFNLYTFIALICTFLNRPDRKHMTNLRTQIQMLLGLCFIICQLKKLKFCADKDSVVQNLFLINNLWSRPAMPGIQGWLAIAKRQCELFSKMRDAWIYMSFLQIRVIKHYRSKLCMLCLHHSVTEAKLSAVVY